MASTKDFPGDNLLVDDVIINGNLTETAKNGGATVSCAVLISNYHTNIELGAPQQYLQSGVCVIQPAPNIRPKHGEVCMFSKKFGSYGSEGLLSYDIYKVQTKNDGTKKKLNDGTRLFLMWSVPKGPSPTYHAVGFVNGKEPCQTIFKEMYYECNDWFKRAPAEKSLKLEKQVLGIPLIVDASISSVGRAAWEVHIC